MWRSVWKRTFQRWLAARSNKVSRRQREQRLFRTLALQSLEDRQLLAGTPSVSLLANPNTINENGGIAAITAVMSQTSSQAVTLKFSFSGTASKPSDYTVVGAAGGSSISIPAGQLSGSFTINAVNDTVFENEETVVVGISKTSNCTLGTNVSTTVRITDDDAPRVTLTATTNPINENGGTTRVVAQLSKLSPYSTTIYLNFSGTATSGVDYSRSGGSIVIPAHCPTGAITIVGCDDTLVEGNEQIVVSISSCQNGTIGSASSMSITILDDDNVVSNPTANDDNLASLAEDAPTRTIGFASLLANDTIPSNSASATITAVGSVVGGTATIVANDVLFTPTPNYNGPASFVYTLSVPNGAGTLTSQATVRFNITEVNDAPSGVADLLSAVAEDSGARTIPFAALLGNDSTGPANESGQSLTITSVGSAVGGTVAISGTNVIFTPAANYNGPASFVYTLQDNGTTNGAAAPLSATASASFTITEVNDAPSGTNDVLSSIAEDSGARTISFASLLGNDSAGPANESGQSLTITSVGSAVGGTVAISGTNVIFTPAANYNGPASFVYMLQDNGTTNGAAAPLSATASASFTITEVNDAPSGTNDVLSSIAEDSAARTISFASLLGNDSTGPANESGQSLTITSVGSAVGGTVAISGTNVIFTPDADYNGPASFVYTLQDNGTTNGVASPLSATASASFTITEVNDAPSGTNDALSSIAEDSGARTISFASLLGNDSTGPANESGQSLTITGVGSAVGGTVAISGSNVIFTPDANYNGPASFAYTLQDNGTTNGSADPLTATATVSFVITEVNDAPSGTNDALSSIAEDSGARTISFASLLGNDSTGPANESGQSLTITGVGSAVGGTVAISGSNIIFTPDADYNGPASFAYTLQDNGTTNGAAAPLSATASASFTITEVNDAPSGTNDALSSIAEDSGARTISFASLLGNDSTGPANESGQSLTITGVGSAVGGTVAISGTNVIFTPDANYNGPASFVYTLQDNGTTNGSADPLTATATVSFVITEVNDAPSGVNDALAPIAENSGPQSISFASLLGNDSAGPANEASQTLSISSVGSAIGGTVAISGTNVIFTPTANYNGPASFVYTLADNGTTNGLADPLTATASVSFVITEVNVAPTGGNDALASIAEDSSPRTIAFASLLVNDSPGPANEASQNLSIIAVGSAIGGSVSIVGTDVIFTPTANYNGPASFTYTLQDDGTTNGLPDPLTATASVTFAITEVNDAPSAGADSLADVINNAPVSIPISSLLGNDSPGPANEASQTLTLISVSGAVGGTATIVGSNVLFTPTTNFEGPGGFSYTIQDNGTTAGSADPLSAVGVVSFNVTPPPNTPPAVDLNGTGVPGNDYPATMTLIGGTVSLVNATTATVADPDPEGIASGTITITNPLDGTSEVLAVNTAGTSLTASFNSSTGVLTLSGLSTPAEYQQVLRTLTYTNLSFNPTTNVDRTISVVLNDGEDDSNVALATVAYAIVPSPPEVDLDGALSVNFGYTTTWSRAIGPVAIMDPVGTVIDTSNVYLQSATVKLIFPLDGSNEVLSANTAGTPLTATYAFSAGNGILSITGLGTVAQYEQVVKSVRYENLSAVPTVPNPRTVSVIVNDGTFNSVERFATVNVIIANVAAVVTTTAGATNFVRGSVTGSIVDTGLTITDIDGTQLQSATITISGGFVAGQDRLEYNGAGGIPSSFNATTGVLTLTGTTSLANYQTALRAVRFRNTSPTGVLGPRTISFSVRDVTAASNGAQWSTPATKTVNVVAPVLAAQSGSGLNAPSIQSADLRPIIDEALARWRRAGASSADMARLQSAQFEIRDLSDIGALGLSDGANVTLDDDGSGLGWFVDDTPRNDREFSERVGRFERQAESGAARDHYDLLTVVMHELGHVIGLPDLDPAKFSHQLMTDTLETGTRRSAPDSSRAANGETVWYAYANEADDSDEDCDRTDDERHEHLRRVAIERVYAAWA